MKKVLLATTMIVAGASIAAAEVTLSGDARMGVISAGSDNPLTPAIDEGGLAFTSRARIMFTFAGETDGGLAFGGSFRANDAGAAAGGTAGSIFLSGAFGKISMGDVDGAAQMATGNVSDVGFTGLGDMNESTFLGAGGLNNVAQNFAAGPADPLETTDPTALYEYSFGDFTVYASHTNTRFTTSGTAAAPTGLNSNATAYAIGGKYTFGDYVVGLGYENLSGFISPAPLAGANSVVTPLNGAKPRDNTDLDHVVLTLQGTFAGITVKGLYGQASGTLAGANIKTRVNNGKQYALSATYVTGAISSTAYYTDDSALGGTAAYGLGAAYDLGGGAQVAGGVARTKVVGRDSTTYDLGVKFSF